MVGWFSTSTHQHDFSKKNQIMKYQLLAVFAILLIGTIACQNETKENMKQQEQTVVGEIEPTHYDWSKNAVIYEVNTRQYSKDGNLDAVTNDLERLNKMGIDIVWLMPIFPISEKNRKSCCYVSKQY